MLYSIIGILVIIFDQLVKYWVDEHINYLNPSVDLIPNVLSQNLVYCSDGCLCPSGCACPGHELHLRPVRPVVSCVYNCRWPVQYD